jgi:anaerobic magnesium-protoporphyrin IX monomethyl ester cyclase
MPGSNIYEDAKRNGWIEDPNLSNYDMIHSIMPTETLSRHQLQIELFKCYKQFYGSWKRKLGGIFSQNELKRRINIYMAGQGILYQLKKLIYI